MGLLDNIAAAKKAPAQPTTQSVQTEEVKTVSAPAPTPAAATGIQSLLGKVINNAAKAPASEYTNLPAGKYSVVISEAQMEKSKAGFDMFKLVATINGEMHPDFASESVYDFIVLEHKADPKGNQPDWVLRNANRLVTTLKKFGADVTTEEGLEAGILALTNTQAILDVKVTKNKDPNKNNGEDYINYSWNPKK